MGVNDWRSYVGEMWLAKCACLPSQSITRDGPTALQRNSLEGGYLMSCQSQRQWIQAEMRRRLNPGAWVQLKLTLNF